MQPTLHGAALKPGGGPQKAQACIVASQGRTFPRPMYFGLQQLSNILGVADKTKPTWIMRSRAAHMLWEHTSISTTGWPTTTSRARARVMATLKRLGLRQNPRCGSLGRACSSAGLPADALDAVGAAGRDSGRDRTVDIKMMWAS